MKITIHLTKSMLLLFAFFLNTLLFAQSPEPFNIALNYLQQQQENLGLNDADISDYIVTDNYTTKHNGVTHLYLQQQYEGIAISGALNNFNILSNGRVSSMGNRFVANLAAKVNTTDATVSAEEAVESLLQKLDIETSLPLVRQEMTEEQEILFFKEGIAQEPVSAKLIYRVISDQEIRLCWKISLFELSGDYWWLAYVDAQTGAVLGHFDQIIRCEFGTPGETCEDHDHAPVVAQKQALPIKSNKLQQENIQKTDLQSNAYHVFPVPIESPNHGVRSMVENPADPIASPYGWHDTNGEAGAEYTITRGNNAHAYQDIFDLGESTGQEPDGGDSLVFDFPFDENEVHPYVQRDAATTNLFYWMNVIHDVWYQYGFDEESGNFQENNYENGGEGGDALQGEVLDGSGRNNAFYFRSVDGEQSRIQMLIWGEEDPPGLQNIQIEALEPLDVSGAYVYAPSLFGEDLPIVPIISEVILVTDSVDVFSDACETILNAADFDGKIAMIDAGGDCQFGTKVLQAEQLGAIAVIMCNDVSDPPLVSMTEGDDGEDVTIPSIMLSLEDCNTLKMGLDSGLVVSFSLGDLTVPEPGPVGVDSDFDNGIIVHEYGHGISIRLTGGPSDIECLFSFDQPEQAGEGWSDWFGLVMTMTPDMTADTPRGIGTYATNEPITGGGIRPFPYTRDMNVNPHTYVDINSEAIPHGVGSVWAAMIYDLYWNLIDMYGFDEDLLHGSGGNNIAMQLVLDGLKLQPCLPNFLDDRDAILEADSINYGGIHHCMIWETFARRGLGFSAEAGGEEAFDVPDYCDFRMKVDKTAVDVAEGGETLTYELYIRNHAPGTANNVIVSDTLPSEATYVEGSLDCNGTVIDGVLTIEFDSLQNGETINCTYQLVANHSLATTIAFEDGMEVGGGKWDRSNGAGNQQWLLNTSNTRTGNFAWFAANVNDISDQYLDLEDPILVDGDSPMLSFWHEFQTEEGIDGGVVELSADGGDWGDAAPYFFRNGYTGILSDTSANPLAGRAAFQGRSGGYINTLIDLSSFQGQNIKCRFRFATNDTVTAEGWYIDDIRFYSNYDELVNTACIDSDEYDEDCASAATVVFQGPVSTFETFSNQLEVSIYPNPTDGQLWIEFLNNDLLEATIKLYNSTGIMLSQNEIKSGTKEHQMNLEAMPSGIYLVQIQTEQGMLTKRILIQ